MSTRYNTASPLKGGVKDWFAEPPAMVPPVVMAPLLGLSHSTLRVRVVADKFTVMLPPFGAYTRYSAPVATLSARQNPVEHNPPCGVIFSKSSFVLAYFNMYPMLSRKLFQRLSGPLHTPFVGLGHRLRFPLAQ